MSFAVAGHKSNLFAGHRANDNRSAGGTIGRFQHFLLVLVKELVESGSAKNADIGQLFLFHGCLQKKRWQVALVKVGPAV